MSTEDVFIAPVVQVLAREPARGGMIEDAYLRRLGDRQFIVGKLADYDGSDPRTGLTFWFAFDEVVMMTEFPDLPTAQNAYKSHEEHKRQKQAKHNKRRSWFS